MADPDPAAPRELPAVTWRSVLLGLVGTVLICGLTPYNDYAVYTTFVVGNFLPVGLVLILLAAILLFNAPLLKWYPRAALRQGELAIAMAMILASCSLPSSGLMRYLPAGIVGTYTAASERPDLANTVAATGLPSWLRPDVGETDPAAIGNSDVYRNYRGRSPDGSVPWAAWIRPLAFWGIFVALMWALMIFLSVIVNAQWAENEKLAFPLATIYASLIEAPAPGRSLNALLSAPGFWIAAAGVFCFHLMLGLHIYLPSFPEIPRGYDFADVLTERPWNYLLPDFKVAEIYFCVIGITYFLQTKTAFSIWFFILILNGAAMLVESNGITFSEQMKQDQTFGATATLACVLIFTGRHHWWRVIKQMFGEKDGTISPRYLPYGVAGWGVVICWIGVVTFLVLMGSTPLGAIFTSLAVLMLLMIIARVVAETGLIFVQNNWLSYRLWYYPAVIPSDPIRTTQESFFVAAWIGYLFHDLRESFATFFQQGLRVADLSAYEKPGHWRRGAKLLLAVAGALVLGYIVSASSMLWTEYHYAATLSNTPESPLNSYAVDYAMRVKTLEPITDYPTGPREAYSHSLHILIGSFIVASLSILRWTVAWWPLNPIGFVILYSWAAQKIWFSVFLGWIAKVIIVKLGDISLWRRGRNVFIGLVVGEATAAGFWLIVSLIAHWNGYEYHKLLLLPG